MTRSFLLHHPDGTNMIWEVPEDGSVYFSDGFAHVSWGYNNIDYTFRRVIPGSRILYYEEKP